MNTQTPIADMVGQMIDAGMPRDMIMLAVQTAEKCLSIPRNSAENSAENAEQRRRRLDRERKRNAKTNAEFPQNSAESAEIPQETIYLKEEDLKKEKKVAAGRKIPPDWKPSEIHFTEGARLGFDHSKVEAFAHDMRLWAEANGNRAVARKADWDKTFLGWLRRQKPGEAPPPSTQPAEPKGRDPPELPPDKRHFYRWFSSKTPEGLPPEQWQAFAEGRINGAEIS